MPDKVMKPIASSEGVNIHCPEDGRFSFFNSPYPAHHSFAGIDVYPRRCFGDVAPSPVRGEVTRVRMVKCPKPKNFEGIDYDYVILLRSSENPERVIKILHVKPLVKVGDTVELGAGLGTLLRSGFFDFWTDPHVHVEVRNPSDPIRARGGFRFRRLMDVDDLEATADNLSGVVVESKPEYSLIALDEKFEHGVPAGLNGQIGLLDAGIPHYGWIGVHTEGTPPVSGPVRLCGHKIGIAKYAYSNMCIAECGDPVFSVNGSMIRLSFYLYPSSTPLVKIIPQQSGALSLEKSEEVIVAIS